MSETARLLVVEDESIVAMDLADTLRQLHYEIAGVVSSGEAAVILLGVLGALVVKSRPAKCQGTTEICGFAAKTPSPWSPCPPW